MATIINQTISNQIITERKSSLLTRFINWSESQEKNRYGWLGLILTAHGCVLTPITLFAIVLSGNNIIFWFMAMAAMGMALTTNLAAMPTKVTIPTFVLSIIIDIALIVSCVIIGFSM